MGIQGMTNWKFSAFLAIALMLVAGMVSTAIASDGAGVIYVAWEDDANPGTAKTGPQTTLDAATARPTTQEPLPSGSTENELRFDYTVTAPSTGGINMQDGGFRLVIPSGWTVSKGLITITDGGDVIYDTEPDGKVDGTTQNDDDADERKLVTILPSSGKNISTVEVKLSDAGWNLTNGDSRTLTILFSLVTAAIPSQLPHDNTASPPRSYQEYRFTAYSYKKDGNRDTRVKSPPGDTSGTNPQPFVWVGNAAAGTGTVTVTPDPSYEGETDRDYRIHYTAPGPMYNSQIRITIPDALIPDALPTGFTTEVAFIKAHTTITQTGGVIFGEVSADDSSKYAVAAQGDTTATITIYVDEMVKGGQVRVFYEDIDVQTMTGDIQIDHFEAFLVQTDTNEDTTLTFTNVAADKGKVRPAAGSGTVKISPESTQINTQPRVYTITYTAATKLPAESYLVAQLPTGAFVDNERNGVPVTKFTEDRTVVEQGNTQGTLNPAYIPAQDGQKLGGSGDTLGSFVSWKVGGLNKGGSFKKEVEQLAVTNASSIYEWKIWLYVVPSDGTAGPPSAAPGDATIHRMPEITDKSSQMLYVLQAGSDPLLPDVTFKSDQPNAGYEAASKQTIEFTFTATKTPIRKGYVSFKLPPAGDKGWTKPHTGDGDGKITVQTDDDGTAGNSQPADLDKKHVSINGQKVTVNLAKLPKTGSVIVTYTSGRVQRTAGEVKITSSFKSGPNVPPGDPRVSNVEDITITNVADGTGMATISPISVDAGSDDNTMTVRFMTEGSMDGGRVRLTSPTQVDSAWGAFQDTDKDGKNYVRSVTSSSGSSVGDSTINDNALIAHLGVFGYGHTLTFVIENIVAERQLGIANFKIESAGKRNGTLTLVKGDNFDELHKPKKRADQKPIDLIGRVWQTGLADNTTTATIDESVDGLLRVALTGGGDGSGEVKTAIIASKAGPQTYTDDKDPTVEVVEERVHAGDDETHIRFTYKPVETIADGVLQFTVATGWSPPQVNTLADDPTTTALNEAAGYTAVSTTDGVIGSVTISGRSLTVPIYSLDRDGSIVINYGTAGGGAVASSKSGVTDFVIKTKGSPTGSLVTVANMEQVTVRSQASGTGVVAIDTSGDVYAGDTERAVTITYTAGGQITGGMLKVTLPEKWSAAMAANFTVSSGSARYGGDMTAAQLTEDADLSKATELVVTGINLSANGVLTLTYTTDVQATAGDATFNFAFTGVDGGGSANLPDQTVTVMEAEAGSGTVTITQVGAIVAGSTGNDLTIDYMVKGQIKGTITGITTEDRPFKVKVPAGWSAPINDAKADDKMGTYAVTLMRKNADGEYAEVTGKIEKQAPEKENTTDTDASYMVARVIPEQTVEKDDKITFTYQNATAPAAPEKSSFKFFFDGTQVLPDLNVIVQSAAGASMLGITSADSFTIEGDPLEVTVKLMAADGSVATRSEATTVTLTSDSATGSFTPATVTIAAGKYEATSAYSDTAVAQATLTASTTATGIADGTKMVTADTDNLSISTVTFAPMYAMVGDTVTVTAMATPLQTATFAVGTIVTAGTMTEGEPGAYSGSFDVVADHHADGMYSVTVSINGTSKMADAQLTIDSAAPTVSDASASAAMAANGDTVTITATASDNISVEKVEADVSALDDTQGMVELAMGDDGSYSAEVTISADNGASNGAKTVTVTATDAAGNVSAAASVEITLQNSISFTSMIPTGANLFHVPLNDPDITTVGDLRAALGDAVSSIIIRRDGGWDPDPDDVTVTADLGIYLVATVDIEHTFEGDAWEDTTVNLESGANLVGLPVNDPSVTMASDISGLFADGVVLSITAGSGGQYTQISEASDIAIAGDAAYYIVAGDVTGGKGTATLTGDGWANGDAANAAPIALSGYRIESQTPALAVYGSVTDEITGLAKEGFRVKVKNLTTKIGLSELTSVETAEGYSMAFVDLKDARAARIGDILEISADSPTPLIGVKPVRHVVTVDDVKNGRITLEDLIAYEIPAETELLRNYPNPFNPETWIPYHLSEDADVKLTIYDVNGALVRDIDVGHQTAAKYDTRAKAIYWDGRNQFGEQVASGIYFYSLEAGDFSATRKMVILK